MKTNKRSLKLWLLGAALALAGVLGARVEAATSDNIDINVSISGNKSLLINTTYYNFGALGVSVSSVSGPSPIQVTNNSTVFIETYTITGANALSNTGGADWTLAASTGADTYALAAQFGDASPANSDAAWTTDSLTTNAIICSDQRLGNNAPGETGTNVAIGAVRNLWFRIKTPGSVSDASNHTATLTLSVL